MTSKSFTHPKSPTMLGVTGPTSGPAGVINPHALPALNTGSRYGDIVGAMILVMSTAHGQGRAWMSVPYHILYFQWMYRELGIKVHSPISGKIPNGKVDAARLDAFPDPESVSFTDAQETLNSTVRHLLAEGFLTGVRDGEADHVVPTDKLVNAIVKD